MTKTIIYLIRHGEVDNPKGIIYGRLDLPLHPTGFQQMEALAIKLKEQGIKPDVIYTSLLQRAVQSAQTLQQAYGDVPIVQENDLQDVNSPGLEGRTLEWLKTIGGDIYNYHGSEVEGISIERPEQQLQRIISVLEKIKREHEGKTVFVVSHGDPLAFTMWRLLHLDSPLPSIAELGKHSYLKKGEAWKVVFDKEGSVIEHELIAKEGEVKGEREY